ncbi:DUF1804 family protein [Riemerella anatipestifer]|uniref:DUF1804 family protein n=1 Tax=Riemerella anatipestifer TaxID=34085 RepID=A0A1S7DV28_RIEAN|nr:DUF1804 family protein [Riemerella anatipestifer]AQY22983.1 hypothetical protein AB406_2043 [Riemerella anatipestifer]MBT0556839.1 hypothetical protein [Riemerella anatipestifer]MCO7355762.1 DUF1804 family protein [Riemerella anatipestifer]MDY3351872.1 DUF1804 family protein [Riemerella anatipestifer]MDY3525055.1 DUF1804 family protein [Riemerella anatipestifer]
MAKRVNNEALRKMAERMYVEEGMTAKAIANAIEVTEQTVGRWKKGIQGDLSWDDKRADFLAAPSNIKKILKEELSNIANGYDPKIDVKALSAVSSAIEKMSDKVNTQVTYSVFKEFDLWMAEQDPELAVHFIEYHRLFLLHKAQNELA